MGKGDKKSKKGKIWKGSYGNSRKRKVKETYTGPKAVVEKAEKVEVVAKPKPRPKAKKAAKKKVKPADK